MAIFMEDNLKAKSIASSSETVATEASVIENDSAPESIQNKSQLSLDVLEQKLIEATDKSEEYLNLLQRTMADFINYKQRVAKETEQQIFLELKKIACELISFKSVLENAIKNESDDSKKEGLIQLNKSFEVTLGRVGLEKLSVQDKEFDCNLCDCVSKIKTCDKAKHNKVADVLQDGYLFNGKLIQPAKVVVSIMEE